MMTECPKCGFAQPEDQYCAKCGVDMIAYRPHAKSLLQQFMASTSSQLVALMVIIAIGFSAFQVQKAGYHLTSLQRNMNGMNWYSNDAASEGATDLSHRGEMPAPDMRKADHAASDSGVHDAATGVAQNPASMTSDSTLAANAPASTAAPAPAATATAAPTTGTEPKPTQLKLIFAEVPKPLLADWMTDAKSPSQVGPMASAVIGDFEKKIKAASDGWQPLDHPVEQSLHVNQIIVVYKGKHDEVSGQNIGLSLQVTPTALDDNGTALSFVGSRNLREIGPQGPQVVEVDFPEQQFVVPKGGAALISGTLLHRALIDEEARFYSAINVLRVMSDEPYRSGATEFVIFIQPH